MKITHHFKYKSDKDSFYTKYPLNISESAHLSYLRCFITSSFDVLVQNNNINIDQLFSAEYDYSINSMIEAITFDVQTKKVYFFDINEENEATDKIYWPYDKPREYYDNLDLTPLKLIKENKIGSTTISLDNFLDFINKWYQLILQKDQFLLLYQNEHDWISCKGFETENEMNEFIKSHSD